MENADPARIIRERPFKSTLVALAFGAALGTSGIARRGVAVISDMALMTSGKVALKTIEAFMSNPPKTD